MASRYGIGIDLGTTNCVLAYVDLKTEDAGAAVLPITQRTSFDAIRESPLLPSFFYYATETETARGSLSPFGADARDEPIGYVIGSFAQDQTSRLPGRVIHSAKSWLAHGGVDREAPMLPFGSEEIPPELRLSPVEASAAYLEHLKLAWDRLFAQQDPGNAFVEQRIVITVPASFDEGAQALTRKAAALAGYPGELRLLEEPQAAFYAWIASGSTAAPGAQLLDRLPALAERPQSVLVLDIGGGTSDFSLFRIAPLHSASARPAIERIATSDHLLLGGDNIDLALAHLMERLLKPGTEERLSRQQWGQLVPQARSLKERIFEAGPAAGEVFPIAVAGEAGSLFRLGSQCTGIAGYRRATGDRGLLSAEPGRGDAARSGDRSARNRPPLRGGYRRQPPSRGVPERSAGRCSAVRRRHAAATPLPGANSSRSSRAGRADAPLSCRYKT